MLRVTRLCATAALSLTLLLGLTSTAAAINEDAAGLRVSSFANLDGFRGQQGIRTNPGTVNGVAFVHPTQMDVGSAGESFIAIGTYNGKGTSGHSQDWSSPDLVDSFNLARTDSLSESPFEFNRT